MDKDWFFGKNVVIFGAGKSGVSSAKLLSGKAASIKITESSVDPGRIRAVRDVFGESVEVEIGRHTREFSDDADVIVVSPGIDIRSSDVSSAFPEGIPIIGELELGYLFCPCGIIAVTGTNGKSTTTDLIGHILKNCGIHVGVCGNIGIPFTDVVVALNPDSVAVVEVSSFQLETIRTFRPDIAVLLNISDDHYDRHGDMQSYKSAKFKIFMNQEKEDRAVIFSSFIKEPLIEDIRSKKIFFGEGTGTGHLMGLMGEDGIPIHGKHNLYNVECAVLVAMELGVEQNRINKAVRSFKGLRHRFEDIGVFNGVSFIDDSKATNIDAARCALESLDGDVIVIAGGIDKGGDYRQILSLVKEKVKSIVVIGEASHKISDAFAGEVPVLSAETMSDAVRVAAEISDEGDSVLLAPMCSSFDMFESYSDRGEKFIEAVGEYYGKK